MQINGAKRGGEGAKLMLGYPTSEETQLTLSNEELGRINPTKITGTMPIATNKWAIVLYPSMTPDQMCKVGTATTNAQATEAGLSMRAVVITMLEKSRTVAEEIGGFDIADFWSKKDEKMKNKYDRALQEAVKIVMNTAEGVENNDCHPMRSLVDQHLRNSQKMNTIAEVLGCTVQRLMLLASVNDLPYWKELTKDDPLSKFTTSTDKKKFNLIGK